MIFLWSIEKIIKIINVINIKDNRDDQMAQKSEKFRNSIKNVANPMQWPNNINILCSTSLVFSGNYAHFTGSSYITYVAAAIFVLRTLFSLVTSGVNFERFPGTFSTIPKSQQYYYKLFILFEFSTTLEIVAVKMVKCAISFMEEILTFSVWYIRTI